MQGRHVYLCNYFNLTRLSIFNDINIVLTRKETAVNLRLLTILRQETMSFA